MADSTKKQHISTDERDKWNGHIGSTGIANHPLANGTTPGFSTCNFTPAEKQALATLIALVGGVRTTVDENPPANPVVNNELWANPATKKIQIYTATGWEPTGAAFL